MKTVGFVVVLYLSVIYTETVSFTSYKQNSQYVVQFQEHVILEKQFNEHKTSNVIFKKAKIGRNNLNVVKDSPSSRFLGDGEVIEFNPGNRAPPMSIWDINGKMDLPNSKWMNMSFILHVFDEDSGFLEFMWNSDAALLPLIDESLNNTHFIFIPKRSGLNETYGAVWMKNRIKTVLTKNRKRLRNSIDTVMNRMHFSIEPVSKLGNWIPAVLQQWQCVDHLCGLDQVVIQMEGQSYPTVLKRLDAHYDWLPNLASVFGNKTTLMINGGDGCKILPAVNHSVAMVTSDGCSYFQKVSQMEKSGALGVVVVATDGQVVQDMNCDGTECQNQLSIPATFVEYSGQILQKEKLNVTFQNTPTSNFFIAIDRFGNMAEVGWFLYPSMNFLVWQAQWFDYQMNLNISLSSSEMTVDVFKDEIMQGNAGVVVNVTLPDIKDLRKYSKMELDMSLSCPGTRDTTCGHWDHTINLYVCCDQTSPLCGMELGRWITAFRRRIGRWLTDVSPLLPLLTTNTCTFTMKTAPWAKPWIPSLNLRFSQPRSSDVPVPVKATPLYMPGATFDKNYNSHFKPINFTVPDTVTKIEIFSVITGHGSDENGCGEFCVTSHHFTVNSVTNNITFSTAGSPLGCADLVHTGVEPNEHGTWLYGRNGWCDGRNVFPWVVDVTQQVKQSGYVNTVEYYGYFNGTDPNPKHNPGIISIYSYLIFYEKQL